MLRQAGPARSDVENAVSETDWERWEAFKQGQGQAFARIYHSLVQDLYQYGLHLTADPSLAEDCVQDLFIYIWDHKETLGSTDNIKFYLLRALKRRILVKIEENQKKNAFLETAGRSGERMDLSSEALLITLQAEADQSDHLERALQALTLRQREAIHLRFYEKLSYAEVARLMSLTIPSTYSLIARAMEVLREQMPLLLANLLLLLC